MTRLSVNLNKVALIRNARGENLPDLRQFAVDCERFGAQGITVHPRPDERHIRYSDIPILKEVVQTELNIEGYPSQRFLAMVDNQKPDQCTLVPDPPGVLTSSEGWNIPKHADFLRDVIQQLQEQAIRVSLFIEAEPAMVEAAKAVGADRIELYTGHYAKQFAADREKAVAPHRKCGKVAADVGIGLNAGHDLNLENLSYFRSSVLHLLEVSIGHALISDALYFGIYNTIQLYLRRLE